jgi:hypothetical protein
MIPEMVLVFASVVVGQPPGASVPKPDVAAGLEPIEVRYARAQVQLAEANLQRVQRMNERLARTVPGSVVAEYRRDLGVSQAQLRDAESRSSEHGFANWLLRAESIWKSADTIWKAAVTINRQSPGTFQSLDIERYRLLAEVTRLQFERGQLLARGPRDAQLEWQVDLLNNEVQRLKEESRMAPFARSWRVWWW